jgi:hypothetical protein
VTTTSLLFGIDLLPSYPASDLASATTRRGDPQGVARQPNLGDLWVDDVRAWVVTDEAFRFVPPDGKGSVGYAVFVLEFYKHDRNSCFRAVSRQRTEIVG